MRRSGLALAAAAVVACSSNPAPATSVTEAPSTAGQTVRVSSAGIGSTSARIVPSGGPNVLRVDAAADRIWKLLPAIYDSLAIPLTVHDVRTRTIGNEGMVIRRRLGKVALSKYLECGRSQMDQNADTYEVTLSVVTRLQAIDSVQTKVTTLVEASAKGLQFAGQQAACTTTGTLEIKFHQLLKDALMRD